MLVLSRKKDESIIIGKNIIITIVDIRGDKVRLGIQAPTEIPVHRQEVYEAIKKEEARLKENKRNLETNVKSDDNIKLTSKNDFREHNYRDTSYDVSFYSLGYI